MYTWSNDLVGLYILVGYSNTLVLSFSKLVYGSTIESIKAKLSETPLQVVYKLATPQTYQLSPTEVTLLLGDNNVWADTGDSTVTYRADTKLYIQKINTPRTL